MNKKIIIGATSLFLVSTALSAVTYRLADPNTLLGLSTDEVVLGKPISLVVSRMPMNRGRGACLSAARTAIEASWQAGPAEDSALSGKLHGRIGGSCPCDVLEGFESERI